MSTSNNGKINPDRKYIATNIKAYRRAKNWSQEALAFESNTTRKIISDIELGKRNAQIDTVSRIAKALDTNLSTIAKPNK